MRRILFQNESPGVLIAPRLFIVARREWKQYPDKTYNRVFLLTFINRQYKIINRPISYMVKQSIANNSVCIFMRLAYNSHLGEILGVSMVHAYPHNGQTQQPDNNWTVHFNAI